MSANVTEAQTKDPAKGSKSKTTKTTKTTKPAPKTESGRQVIQDVIMSVLKNYKDGATPNQLEAAGQKAKSVAKGRYAAVGKSEFVLKDGKILAQVSERGFKIGIKYTVKRGTPHWSTRTFPKEAAEVAKEMKVTLPASASPVLAGSRNSKGCPGCAMDKLQELRKERGVTGILPEEVTVLNRHGITDPTKAFKEWPQEGANYSEEVLVEVAKSTSPTIVSQVV